jgi:uncharacterized membrane protein
MAIGAATGAAAGAASDTGVDDDFVKRLGEQLPRAGWLDPLIELVDATGRQEIVQVELIEPKRP